MLPVSVPALPLLVPAVSPSCFRPVTVASEMVMQTQRPNNASPTMVPTGLCSSPNSPPLAHSECTPKGHMRPSDRSDTPSVTSVGGTNYIPETAVFFSGGGFSNYVGLSSVPLSTVMLTSCRHQFPRPDYQEMAVTTYLEKLAPGTYEGLYNPYVFLASFHD